jgi:hypothetical protein
MNITTDNSVVIAALNERIAGLEKEVSIALRLHSNMNCNIKELKKENKELAYRGELIGLPFKDYKTECAESVAGIALRNLGSEKLWVEIARLNSLDFPDVGPNDYYPVGTVLLLPIRKTLEAHNLEQRIAGMAEVATQRCPNSGFVVRDERSRADILDYAKALKEQGK